MKHSKTEKIDMYLKSEVTEVVIRKNISKNEKVNPSPGGGLLSGASKLLA